jgi:hypothetical protein
MEKNRGSSKQHMILEMNLLFEFAEQKPTLNMVLNLVRMWAELEEEFQEALLCRVFEFPHEFHYPLSLLSFASL